MDNPCEVNGSQDEADYLASNYAGKMESMGRVLLHGTATLEDFHQGMQDAIRLAILHQAVAGTPDGDIRQISADDRTRLESAIAEQFKYLDNFMDDIVSAVETPGASLDFIPNRAGMYAKSSEAQYWKQAVQVDLPAMPRDGSTVCLGNCQCSWDLQCEDDGTVKATWVLGDADHCDDCIERAREWVDLDVTPERA